jgi:hypothetical protein
MCTLGDTGDNMACWCRNYYYGMIEFNLVSFSTQKYQGMPLPYDKGDEILRKITGV